ncbi:cytokinin dehydrogenase 4-like [Cucurbita pepo subsp. pepo]|uniref:cytokinin dehydrogenase 4-like n=1 Tax=Cucurbita pepo subsp. pepo TaxID=3664 RepID=UPI000C9D4C21|nr:cytokinin dehydrogenase 4-like [Cucurbita pepo subsp. pepo]
MVFPNLFLLIIFTYFLSLQNAPFWAAADNLSLPESLAEKLRDDPQTISLASTDYGRIIQENPIAVFFPVTGNDIAFFIRVMYAGPIRLDIAARGQGHSVRGQALARNGVVMNMTSLANSRQGGGRIVVKTTSSLGPYADVGGEQLWIDVLHETMRKGFSPVSWTDYLHMTVGGTLSNAGISGQTFRFGPQISNVYELDVVTGKGESLTCSPTTNPELFYAVLGGLGQFGVITRAKIALAPTPTRVKWVRMLYTNFSAFTSDQELLISNNGNEKSNGLNFVEGLLLLQLHTPDNSSFYPLADQPKIASLVSQYGIVYVLEVVKYYDQHSASSVDQELNELLGELKFEEGLKFVRDASYEQFLDRVHTDEVALRSLGLWDVPHPWLNLFIPKSRIADFDSGVFRGIIQKRNITSGVFLIYPMLKNKWDERTSAVIPDEDVFYTAGILFLSGFKDWETFDGHNKDILRFCAEAGIKVKQYLPHYETQQDWMNHFGRKWPSFLRRKAMFDPKKLLSPGQKIFSTSKTP